jgi:hypothetical protein
VHQRHIESSWCANRNCPAALAFVAFCCFVAAQSWRQIGKDPPERSSVDLIFYLVAIALIVTSYVPVFPCVRERLVLGIMVLRLMESGALILVPGISTTSVNLLQRANFALWSVALGVSLSMLYSSLRNKKKGPDPSDPSFNKEI